jgi:CRISPR-associated protein Cpf1
MFYVRPDYTSTTDPLTGWRKTRYISNSANHEEVVRNFDYRNKDYIKIFFDKDKDCFRFDCDGWSLFSFKEIERYYWSNKEKNASGNYGVSKKYLLDECFSDLFSDIDKTLDINGQILSAWEKKDQRWKTLVFYWNLLNQIRNTDRAKEGDENDFIQSPVWSEEIKGFFDSRCCYNKLLPNNGDANGAYNIARKGLLVLERVKENPVKPDLFIRNEDWDDFIR